MEIHEDENFGELHDRMKEKGANLVLKTSKAILMEQVKPFPQRLLNGEKKIKLAPKISREFCLIDWGQSIDKLHNFIRGLSPYPCAFSKLLLRDNIVTAKIYKTTKEYADHNLCRQS